jgi:hypothetical protein
MQNSLFWQGQNAFQSENFGEYAVYGGQNWCILVDYCVIVLKALVVASGGLNHAARKKLHRSVRMLRSATLFLGHDGRHDSIKKCSGGDYSSRIISVPTPLLV